LVAIEVLDCEHACAAGHACGAPLGGPVADAYGAAAESGLAAATLRGQIHNDAFRRRSAVVTGSSTRTALLNYLESRDAEADRLRADVLAPP